MADEKRKTTETQGTAGGSGSTTRASPGMQESEEAGVQQMSRMLREAREEGDPEMQGSTGQEQTGTGTQTDTEMRTGTGTQTDTEMETGDVALILYVQECAVCERERGMSDRERGMADRERAMFDRECAMTDRERSSAWGEREGQSSAGGMSSEQSRTGGRSGSSRTQTNR